MTNDIHVLMRDTDDVDARLGGLVKDHVHSFRVRVVAGFYVRTRLSELRVFR